MITYISRNVRISLKCFKMQLINIEIENVTVRVCAPEKKTLKQCKCKWRVPRGFN